MEWLKIGFATGFIASAFYMLHSILGNILWKEYNPVTTDISSLTADGAPNKGLLTIFTTIYGVLLTVFSLVLVYLSFQETGKNFKTGAISLCATSLISFIGFGLYPLPANKEEPSFQGKMHIIIAGVVAFLTIFSAFFLAFGIKARAKSESFGSFLVYLAAFLTVFGLLNPVQIALKWNILGITERLVIYTFQLMVTSISVYFTFYE